MAVADLTVPLRWKLSPAWRENAGFTGLFAVLSAFTLSTLDGGDIAPRLISAALLLFAVLFFALFSSRRFTVPVPAVCLLLMACYGVIQTLWFPHKIVYDGWSSVLFWFTAAVITLLSAQLFRRRQLASRFRLFFVFFGSAVCVLDLLEQASHTSKYFWLIQSKYSTINGSFAYWNNFAQFVELFLPLTLWFALKGRKPSIQFLLLSGLEIGAVVASGSRAGSALVIVELLAMLLLAYLRNRNRAFLYAAASALAVSAVFVIAAGSETLSVKLQQKDQLAVRRDINESSLEMIRRHPFTGWGLGAYVPVYRMFARYDDGTLREPRPQRLAAMGGGRRHFLFRSHAGRLRLEHSTSHPVRLGHRRNCRLPSRPCRLSFCAFRRLRLVLRPNRRVGRCSLGQPLSP